MLRCHRLIAAFSRHGNFRILNPTVDQMPYYTTRFRVCVRTTTDICLGCQRRIIDSIRLSVFPENIKPSRTSTLGTLETPNSYTAKDTAIYTFTVLSPTSTLSSLRDSSTWPSRPWTIVLSPQGLETSATSSLTHFWKASRGLDL